jgi:hypothetical protein
MRRSYTLKPLRPNGPVTYRCVTMDAVGDSTNAWTDREVGIPVVRLPEKPTTTRALRQYRRQGFVLFMDLSPELRNGVYGYAI